LHLQSWGEAELTHHLQLTCSITQHVLERFLTLFAPITPPPGLDKKWADVAKACRDWYTTKRHKLDEWAKYTTQHVPDHHGYLGKKQQLLEDLSEAGGKMRKPLLDLKKLLQPTEEAIEAVIEDGFQISVMAFVATTKIRLTGYTFSFILHLQRTLSHHMFLFAMFISHWLALMNSLLNT